MSLEYHLVTPFGLGQTSTLTIASPCVVTIPAGTKLRDGNPVVFTTSGALPTGVISGTTYYSRWITDTTYHLYDTEDHAKDTGATTGRVTTSGTQSGTHNIIGGYWYNLPTADPGGGGNYKNRYYFGASYQVYGHMNDWHTGRNARIDFNVELICEYNGDYTDTKSGYSAYLFLKSFRSITMTSKLNGVYGKGFHYGFIDRGYIRDNTYTQDTVSNSTGCMAYIHGLHFISAATTYSTVFLNAVGTVIESCFVKGARTTSTAGSLWLGSGCTCLHNFVYNCAGIGITIAANYNSIAAYYNTVTGCGTGFYAGQAAPSSSVYIIGNVSIGNTLNWSLDDPANGYWHNNAGITGDVIWASSGASSVVVDTDDFANYIVPVTASSDFRPSGDSSAHTSSSALVDIGSQYYSVVSAIDIAGNVRPSYKNGSATGWDLGAYEFDWGYGEAPQTLIVTNLVSGSIVKATRTDTGAVLGTATESGGSVAMDIAYSGNITVTARKGSVAPTYKEYVTQIVFPGTTSVVALQELD